MPFQIEWNISAISLNVPPVPERRAPLMITPITLIVYRNSNKLLFIPAKTSKLGIKSRYRIFDVP